MASGNKANKKPVKTQQKKNNGQEKSKSKECRSSSTCPWIMGIIVLLFSIGALIAYDTHRHDGVFAKSKVGVLLKDAGALPYVEQAWIKSMSSSARGYQWTLKNVPIFWNVTYVTVTPYAELSRDISILAWGSFKRGAANTQAYLQEKSPIVVNYIDGYVPGLPRKIQDASTVACDIITLVTKNAYSNTYSFFRTKVFVGPLSPQNLNELCKNFFAFANEMIVWFHQKVDIYAKMQ